MTRSLFPLLLLLFLIITTTSHAQEGLNQEISIKNFKLLENESDFFSGKKGLKITFEAHFTEIIKEFSKQSYTVTWRLENTAGEVVFDSKNASSFGNKDNSIRATAPFDNSSASYGLDKAELFIAYNDLNLPDGENNYKLVLSAAHSAKKFPDFWSKTIKFNYKKTIIQTSDKQIFSVKNVKASNTDFGGQKLEIKFTMHLAYGPGEIEDRSYPYTWQLLDTNGKEIYNANQDFFTKNKSIYLKSYKEDSKNGGFFNNESATIDYKYLSLSGNHDLTFVLYIIRNGEQQKIHEQKINHTLIELHQYKDQAFAISNLAAKPGKKNGVSGISVSFDCKFKYNKIAQNNGENLDFYFYINLLLDKKEIYSIGEGSLYNKREECAIVSYESLSRSSSDYTFYQSLFIPYFLLNTTPGSYKLELNLVASNATGSIRFDKLGKTSIQCTKPKTISASFDLTNLTLIDRAYDPAIGNNYINQKSDTQWFIDAGNYSLYISPVNKNMNEGIKDKVDFIISEGDELRLVIIDQDKLFNPSDILASIPLELKSKTVTDYKKGDIKSLSYKLVVESPK